MRCALAAATVLGLVPAGHALCAEESIGRLGRDVAPVSQSIVLDLDPRKPDYTGSVEIVLEVRKVVPTLRFHAENLDLLKLELGRVNGTTDPIVLTATAQPDGTVEAKAETAIAPGRYALRISFHNDFDTEAKGLYRLRTGDLWYAFTQFEAVDAREAFPCWDEPSFKIPYTITLTVPDDQMALANTPESRTVENEGRRTTVFAPTRPLPSYLLAVAVGPFEAVAVPGTSVPTRIIVTKGTAALAADAVKMTPPILAALERYFGSRYPYEKLDFIAVPEYWYGAMENPGLITFLDRALLLDSGTAGPDERETLAVYIAHELAHMWFGDLVTMAWWDDLWLNESFATWMEQKILIELYPEFDESVGQVRSAQRVMGIDTLLTTRAMRQPVKSVDSLLQSADALAYAKGAAVLNMVERWIGPGSFRAGVLDYLKSHADGNATADDLWAALGKASKQDVRGTLGSFLNQAGVPLVTLTVLPEARVRLTQTRFLAAGTKAPKAQLWTIPVAIRYPDGKDTRVQRVLLSTAEMIVPLETKTAPAWIHPNADEAGYYRWSIPTEALEAMSSFAPRALTTRERVGFLGNVSALMTTGHVPGDIFVRALESFATEQDPEVVDRVADGLDGVREDFFSERDAASFAPFVRRTLSPALARVGLRPVQGEKASVTRLRPRLYAMLADVGRDESALSEMEGLGRAYLADRTSVDPSLVEAAVVLSAIRGDAALFEAYRQRFESARIPAERTLFLGALGNFRNPALVDRALAYVLEGSLRPQELFTIPRMMGDVPSSRGQAWTWMTVHYDEIAARIPADYMIFMPRFASGCSAERLTAAKAFFADPKHSPPGTSKELARVAEEVSDCVTLDAREGAAVRRYTTAAR
jgi:alanyl aminopeptidase